MINTLKYRLKSALKVFLGKAKIEKPMVFTGFKESIISDDFKKELERYSYEFIFTEFGKERVNAGGAVLDKKNRLEPSLSGIKKFFPNAKITVFTDFDWEENLDLNIVKVESPIPFPEHARFGYRTGNYFKFKGLLDSTADFACALDTDMLFVNENIYSLVTLTKKFGFCTANNSSRQLINKDMAISHDTQNVNDDSLGNAHSYNQSPMTLWRGDDRGKVYYNSCLEIMKDNPSRGSLVMYKAAWKTGVYPYVLPMQFCVCDGDIGCGYEILLHIGHPRVAKYYGVES